MDAVLMGAQSQIGMVLELERMVEILDSLPESQQNVFNYDAQIVKLKEEIERNKNFKLKLYKNLQEGMIGQEEYFLFKKSYADKIQAAETAIAAIETERSQTVSQNRERLAWIGVYKKYQNVTEITRRMVVDLIDQIVIQEGNGVNITWRYWDDYSRIIDSFANISDEVKIQLMA
jgi:ribosomal protein L11 methylase PrmA